MINSELLRSVVDSAIKVEYKYQEKDKKVAEEEKPQEPQATSEIEESDTTIESTPSEDIEQKWNELMKEIDRQEKTKKTSSCFMSCVDMFI